MLTKKQKPIVETQKTKKKKSKYTTTENDQITVDESKRGKNKRITKQPENIEQNVNSSTNCSIIF